MNRWIIGLMAILALALAACGSAHSPQEERDGDSSIEQLRGGGSGNSASLGVRPAATPAPLSDQAFSNKGYADDYSAAGPTGPMGPAGPAGPPGAEGDARLPSGEPAPHVVTNTAAGAGEVQQVKLGFLQTAERQVISSGSISMEVPDVASATTQVRVIVEGLGGYIEQLSSSGGPERQTSNLTLRMPQPQFFVVVERIEALGKVQARNLGSEDVSEQFVDLQARLQSAQREEASLLALLEKTTSVSEILTVERELNRVRAEVERLQGQLNFLERRVALATLSVALYPPQEKQVEPPSGSLTIEVSDVDGSAARARNVVTSFAGVVDGSYVVVQDGQERANLSLRVYPNDFSQVLAGLEQQGEIKSKEIRAGGSPQPDLKAQGKDPTAFINLTIVEKPPWFTEGLIYSIAALSGVGIFILAVIVAILLITYRAGRRRGQRTAA